MFEGKHSHITDKVLEAFYKVYRTLGYGFSEGVYANAMALELRQAGLAVKAQKRVMVYYGGCQVGEYRADLVVADLVIVELKAVRTLLPEHQAQVLNYLKATEMEVGLLLNFGPKAEFRREILSNERKGAMTWVKQSPGASEEGRDGGNAVLDTEDTDEHG